MSGTDYLEGKFLDHFTGNGAYTPPTALYLCLHTQDPTESGTVGQVSGGNYAPQLITFGPQISSRSVSTNGQVFGGSAPGMPACTVTHFVIRENSTTGNPCFVGLLTNQRSVAAGDPLTFGAGAIALLAD